MSCEKAQKAEATAAETSEGKKEAHVVALSGGKDSTALALRLLEVEPQEYRYVCTPTGDELPSMREHWDRVAMRLGAPLEKLTAKHDLDGLIEHYSALPNNRMRWCTRILKIQPFQAFIKRLQVDHEVTVYVGLRADEEARQGSVYSTIVNQRFPLREWGWGLREVLGYLDKVGVTIPARTDCARCYHQTLGEWWRLWHDHSEIYADAEAQEAMTKHTFRNASRDTWPAGLLPLRKKFEAGHVPPRTQTTDDLFGYSMCRVCSL